MMIIDGATVLTGSFNWTEQAENDHAENLISTDDPVTVAMYQNNFNVHAAHSLRQAA